MSSVRGNRWGLLQQQKTQVVVGHVGEPHVVQEADRDGWLELHVILALVKLLLVQPAGVVQDALVVGGRRYDLHLDVELSPRLVAGLDVEDRQLVVHDFLGVERIEQLELFDPMSRGTSEYAVQQIDKNRARAFATEEVFEGIIDGR
jgi:hypothetical protein